MLFFWHPLILDFSPGLSLHTLLWNVAWCKLNYSPQVSSILAVISSSWTFLCKKQEIMISPPSNLQIMKETCVPKTRSRLKFETFFAVFHLSHASNVLCSMFVFDSDFVTFHKTMLQAEFRLFKRFNGVSILLTIWKIGSLKLLLYSTSRFDG